MNDRCYDPVCFEFKNKKLSDVEDDQNVLEFLENTISNILSGKDIQDDTLDNHENFYIPKDALIFEKFKDAILGYDLNDQIVYSYDVCISILMDDENMNLENAIEYLDNNIVNIKNEKSQPIFVKYI